MSDRPDETDEPIDRSLIDAAKPALGPSDAQRARLKRAVIAAAVGSAAAGTAAVASGTGVSATSAAGLGVGAKIALAVFAVAAIGGGTWLITRNDEGASVPDEIVTDAVEPEVVEPESDPIVEPEPEVLPEPDAGVDAWAPEAPEPQVEADPETDPRPPVGRDFADIERETEMLREAHAASRRGDPRAALALLDEHARRFPRGDLATERRGLRILALCDLGDTEVARREAVTFLAGHPPSGLAERVHRSCAGQGQE